MSEQTAGVTDDRKVTSATSAWAKKAARGVSAALSAIVNVTLGVLTLAFIPAVVFFAGTLNDPPQLVSDTWNGMSTLGTPANYVTLALVVGFGLGMVVALWKLRRWIQTQEQEAALGDLRQRTKILEDLPRWNALRSTLMLDPISARSLMKTKVDRLTDSVGSASEGLHQWGDARATWLDARERLIDAERELLDADRRASRQGTTGWFPSPPGYEAKQ